MKQKFLIIPAVSAALLLTGCGSRNRENSAVGVTETANTTENIVTTRATEPVRDNHHDVVDDTDDTNHGVLDDARDMAGDIAEDGREIVDDVVDEGRDIITDIADGAKDAVDGTDENDNYITDDDGRIQQ